MCNNVDRVQGRDTISLVPSQRDLDVDLGSGPQLSRSKIPDRVT